MSARAAVSIINRRELNLAKDRDAEHTRLADEYADEHLRAGAVAAAGFVDESSSSRTRASDLPGRCTPCLGPRRDPDGKRLLITGVITKESIAYHVAERAQREGATVLLTSFGGSVG